jgi:5'-phosphate synthase pdxT subunit
VTRIPIGVLALQGGFAAHARALEEVEGWAREVRRPEQLVGLAGLILPGGESTALLQLMDDLDFAPALRAFQARGAALWGTCAGLILLARDVDPPQSSLGILDVTVLRNAYGRQVDSFIGKGTLRWNGAPPEEAEMVFIRAPRIVRVGAGVDVVGQLAGEATFVRDGRIWGTTFHPELSDGRQLHARFLHMVREG